MNRLLFAVVVSCALGAASAETLELALTKDMTFAEALAVYNVQHQTSYVDTDGGTSLGACDVVVTGGYKLTFSKALGSWTGDLTVKSPAFVYAVSDTTSYATVLGAAVSGSVTNGQVFVESGATLAVRTNSNGNDDKLARPIHLAGDGKDGKGALRLTTTTNIRAMYPKYIHLDADASFSRYENDGKADGGTVLNNTSFLFLNGHVLSMVKDTVAMILVLENVAIPVAGTGAGLVIKDGNEVTFRANTAWAGDATNFVRIERRSSVGVQQDYPANQWRLELADGASNVAVADYQDWGSFDDTADVRCWRGPASLGRAFTVTASDSYKFQAGLKGKVSGTGGICLSSTGTAKRKDFHLASGENDFTGGIAVTNFSLRLGSPTAIPTGAGKGPARFHNAEVDLNAASVDPATPFQFPDTTLSGKNSFARRLGGFPSVHFGALTLADVWDTQIGALFGADSLTMNGGSLKLSSPPNGLVYGYEYSNNTESDSRGYVDMNAYGWSARTNGGIIPVPYDFDASILGGKSQTFLVTSRAYRTYKGYIWNPEPEPKTWTFMLTLNIKYQIKVGEQSYRQTGGSNPAGSPVLKNFVLQPGANAFEFLAGNQYVGEALTGASKTNGITNADADLWRYGLLIDRQGRQSMDYRDYEAITGRESPPLFSAIDNIDHEVGTLSGTGRIDLDGSTLKVGTLMLPGPTVVNGKLVAESATMAGDTYPQAIQFTAGNSYTVDINSTVVPSNRTQLAGLVYGCEASNNADGSSGYVDMNAYGWTPRTNSVLRLPYDFLTDQLGGWSGTFNTFSRAYRTYSGYFWNDSPTNELWTFMSTVNQYQQLRVGTTYVRNSSLGTDPISGGKPSPFYYQARVSPGANYFEFISGNMYVSSTATTCNYGPVRTNEVANWTSANLNDGFLYKRGGSSTDAADYSRFSADEPLPLLTADRPAAFVRILFEEGAQVDLSGRANAALRLEGPGAFANGSLRVMETWLLTADEIVSPTAVAQNLVFDAGSVLTLAPGAYATLEGLAGQLDAKGLLLGENCTGRPKLDPAVFTDRKWKLRNEGGRLYLRYGGGLFVIVK